MPDSGNITINAGSIEMNDEASITVRNRNFGRAGELNINSGSLTLRNGSQITSIAAFGEGGNLTFNIDEVLLLRRGSLVSSEAGQAADPTSGIVGVQGSGGNITIRALFTVAVPAENSNIIANAFGGEGGQVRFIAVRNLGLVDRTGERLTSDQLINVVLTSDVTPQA